MGVLKGDVDILGLGTLLQTLAMNGREGVLSLYKDMDRKTIYFGPHGIRLLSTTMKRVNRLGKILVRLRKITTDDLKNLLEEQKLVGWKLGQIALNTGKITKHDLETALHEQVQEEIFDLFMWKDAAFEFADGPPKEKSNNPLAELTIDTNVTSIILEAARRADELLQIREIVNDEEMIPKLTGATMKASPLADDKECAQSIVPLINGKRTTREILAGSVYPRFTTMRALYAMIQLGYVEQTGGKSQTRITKAVR